MGRFHRILRNPSKYLSASYLINNVIGGRLFVLWMNISPLIKSDKLYIKIFYRLGIGKKLNLNNPVTYTEKLQWLKLHNIDPSFSRMVDKFQARKIVAEKIGEGYLVPLLGVWDRFEDINFENLPNEFVLKTTHDSGTIVICKGKIGFDFLKAKKILSSSLKRNYFYKSREYPYRNAKPAIIAEKLLKEPESSDLTDYKLFCFNGLPKLLLVVSSINGKKYNSWFDINFKPLAFNTGLPAPPLPPKRPDNFEEMIKIAKELSKGLVHIRIDLYNIDGRIYFGEFTFHHAGGIIKFEPKEWDNILGNYICIV